ncbi:hypothetical protein [Poseidonibacter ostreae]|uniref:Uncharacterized protein n=1 Tax=Poseidonibacter ostreae TaxID=2654171 RepID=A0A6L4WTS4_9BACT|nr:hypothetical protein [Poseidonibacter ostreae]KAB7889745.1 hypothetical protein GBG19_05020 [Poseidonibacter ostreae]
MKIKSGNIKLEELLKECGELITRSVHMKYYKKSLIFEKIKPAFIDMILKKHLTFYVPKNILDDSKNTEDNFSFYSRRIFATEDIYYLLFLKNLSDFDKRDKEVNWVIIEADRDIKKSIEIKELMFLDYYLKRKNFNEKGLIDYELYESILVSTNETIKKDFLKRVSKNFLSNIFSLNLFKKSYAPRKLMYYKYVEDIILKKNMNKYIYVFYCPVCGFPHHIYLNGHEKANVNKFIKLDENSDRIIFECKHLGSELVSKIKFGFKRKRLKGELKSDEIYNKVFLYFFYTFKYKDDKTFAFCKSDNIEHESSISKYIEKYK